MMRWAGLAVLLGCVGLTAEAAEKAPGANDALLDLAGRGIAALQKRGGDDARVLRLNLGPDEATLDVQDPAKPAHVDRFAWREGRLEGPEPVAVGRNPRQLKAQLFALREVRLEVIERTLSEAVHATETEDGRVTRVIIERDSYSSDFGDGWTAPQVRVYVDGPRGGGFLQRNVDGKRRRVVRW
jgi:hypothetical protein